MRTTLTENAVRAAQPGSTLWDGSLKHFGLRVAPGGTKSFLVLLGSGRRQAIGRYPEITLARARVKAKRILWPSGRLEGTRPHPWAGRQPSRNSLRRAA